MSVECLGYVDVNGTVTVRFVTSESSPCLAAITTMAAGVAMGAARTVAAPMNAIMKRNETRRSRRDILNEMISDEARIRYNERLMFSS